MKKIFILLFLLNVKAFNQEKITVLTSEFPPYNYTNKSGKLVGLNTEIVQEVLKELNIEASIESKPWARIYEETQNSPNVLLFSITRTAPREKLFKWIGVLSPADYSLWVLSKRTDIPKNIDKLKDYLIGTTTQDVVDQYLRSLGLNVESVAGQTAYDQNIHKLLNGRIDIWGVATLPGSYFIDVASASNLIKRLLIIEGIPNDGMYLAFGSKTDDALVEKFRKALEIVKKKPKYKELLTKYKVNNYYPNYLMK